MKQFPGARYCAILVVVMLCGVLVAPPAQAFSDTHGHWAAFYIDHLTARGLIAGYPDGSFKPQDSISRAEFATLVVSVLHKQGEASTLQQGRSSFSDCQGNWAQGSIEMAYELGLTYGARGSRFEPERDTTREEAAVILSVALGCPEAERPALKFSDAAQISEDAVPYIACALSKGLINGMPDGSFRPGDPLSRAQVAVIMNRFMATQGEDFDFYGVVKSVEESGRLHILTGGSEQTFDLAQRAVIYDRDCASYASRIPQNSPLYFDVDDSGRINFACLSSDADNLINLSYRQLPDYDSGSSSGSEPWQLTGMNYAGEDDPDSPVENPGRDPADALSSDGPVLLGQEIDEESVSSEQANPATSLDACRAAMKADQFVRATGVSGHGQLIAIIDSGVDPGHPDLQTTSQGQPKLLDYIDLTEEGRVNLAASAGSNGTVDLDGILYNVKGITSADRIYRVGLLPKSSLPADFACNLTMSGLAVLAVCSTRSGECDRLYLDLDGDCSFTDENPVSPYSVSRQTVTLVNAKKARLNLAVAEMDRKGGYIKLGFDGLGHGTTVAGVAAACGLMQGVAPGASILPIKIVNRAGATSIDLLKEAVSAARDRGARIAVISMGQAVLSSYDRGTLEALARTARDKYGMILVMAAGNNGPGLESVNQSSDISSIISVGAYATPEMWKNDYGWNVKSSTLWYFSPAGPGLHAGVAPLVVAPGSAVSCYPLWSSQSYRLVQGTSIAAPNLAGALALLLEASPSEDYLHKTRQVWEAVLNGASALPGYQPVEQGYGAVDLMGAWENMQKNTELAPDLNVSQSSPGLTASQGLYTRGMAPGQFGITITNDSDSLCELVIARAAAWMSPAQNSLQLPARSSREFEVNYADLEDAGLYSTLLVADDKETLGFDAVAMQTVVIPVRLDELPNKTVAFQGRLGPGLFQRYFFEVPEGSAELQFNLDVTGSGRVRLYVFDPSGRQYAGEYVGDGADQKRCELEPDEIAPGIWEAVVYSSASLSQYGSSDSEYMFTTSLKKTAATLKSLDSKYLVSCLPSSLLQNIKQSMVTLRFWSPDSKQAASGIVSVNGRLYEIRDGMVQLEQPVAEDRVNIEVGW